MAPRPRPAPMDKFTDASATAISSGFSAAMALGPQPNSGTSGTKGPKGNDFAQGDGGTTWLNDLRAFSGVKAPRAQSRDQSVDDPMNGENGEDSEDEDEEMDDGDSPAGGKKGGKKGKGKAAAAGGRRKAATAEEQTAEQRKAQNRIAQREFRQRKQQYIRALEARVELLSSDHDTQVDRLRWALRGLLTENNQLREALVRLASFIGDDLIGGPLQKRGMDRDELEELVNSRAEKTLTTQWQNWPGATECEALQQIRAESNLPPEGLPESHRPGEFLNSGQLGPAAKKGKRAANSAAAAASAAAGEEDTPANRAKRATKGLGGMAHVCVIAAGNQPAPANLLGPDGMPRTSVMESSLGQPPQAEQRPIAPVRQTTAAAAPQSNFFDLTSNGFPNDFSSTVNGSIFGSNMNGGGMNPYGSGFTPGGDSDAILTSLFGAEGMQMQNFAFSPSGSGAAAGSPQAGAAQSHINTVSTPGPNQGSNGGMPGILPIGHQGTASALANNVGLREMDAEELRQNTIINAVIVRANRARQRAGRTDFLPLNLGGVWMDGKPRPLPTEIPEAVVRHVDANDKGNYPLGRVRDSEELERLADAVTQMQYHMVNYRKNPAYRLPPILKPSDLQQTQPHDPIIDGIPFTGLRDALIRNQDSLDITEVWIYMIENGVIHEGDMMTPSSWEMTLPFYLRFPMLIDETTLTISNRWRRLRGEPSLTADEIRRMAASGQRGVAGV